MISLLIAGGVYVVATSQTSQTTEWSEIDNHTLRGEAIPASQVVCRSTWGTPMLPDGKGGYSLIAPINPIWIAESLIIPPRTSDMVAYRPLPASVVEAIVEPEPAPAPAAVPTTGPVPAPAPVAVAPDAAAPASFDGGALPVAPGTEGGVAPAAPGAAPADPFAPAAPAN